ncbi:transposase [Pararhizobium sp. LjRoot255]
MSAVDAPERFRSSRAVGRHFGLTPKKHQSGETDYSDRISKIGDVGVANRALRGAQRHPDAPREGFGSEELALAVARRAGPRKARCTGP